MSDSNIGFRPVIRTRERSESQLPPHWSRRDAAADAADRKSTVDDDALLDKITRSSSTLDAPKDRRGRRVAKIRQP